ncbi:hypothetical protein ACYPKM_04345 [Pseudomonas aeruginosa]
MKSLKYMIFGHKRHGKDTCCEYLEQSQGLTFVSSSMFACKEFIFDQMKDEHGYKSPQECFDDRDNHRSTWYDAIRAYNDGNRTRLGSAIYGSHDIYCGIRDRDEFYALKAAGAFDLAIWIDAGERLPPEDQSSMNLTINDADIVITNNGTLEEFHARIDRLMAVLRQAH